jgi:tRNA 2-thiouridine synthesizing protein E
MSKRLYSTTPQRSVRVGGSEILLDSEGYLCRLDDWSAEFAVALAAEEGLVPTDEHWEVIRYLRDYYRDHGVQAQVRAMIRHFTQEWGPERGNNHYLHEIFPRGGPQKQGNRLAGLLRTKGEH